MNLCHLPSDQICEAPVPLKGKEILTLTYSLRITQRKRTPVAARGLFCRMCSSLAGTLQENENVPLSGPPAPDHFPAECRGFGRGTVLS